tara:strand:+ start:2575 stop:3378 length:804 start_codon:yes stop_codon:yes gene_type:complete
MGYKPDFVKEDVYVNNTVLNYNIGNTEIIIAVKLRKRDFNRINDSLTFMYLKELIPIIYNMTTNRRNKVTIKYFQTKNKKLLPKQKLLTENEVNSGLCYINSRDGDVNIEIYREEEFYKVLTHEMLHLYNVIPKDPQLEHYFRNRYNKLCYINTNESLVELNALIINSIIIHKLFGEDFNVLIEKEYQWSRNQRDKLKKFFGIESDMETNHKWKETTHAYSYFVTKTDLLDHILDNMNYVSAINKCKYEYNLSLRMTINDAKNYKIT